MEQKAVKKKSIALVAVGVFLSLPLALAVIGGWGMWKDRRAQQVAQTEFNEALKQSLERAADVALPAPSMGDGALVLECPVDQFEVELQRVVRLAKGVGGSASSWNDGESVRLVASVPGSAETLFREAVDRGVYDLNAAGETGARTVVEVLIKPVVVEKKPKRKKK
jgi:hypothetical protein